MSRYKNNNYKFIEDTWKGNTNPTLSSQTSPNDCNIPNFYSCANHKNKCGPNMARRVIYANDSGETSPILKMYPNSPTRWMCLEFCATPSPPDTITSQHNNTFLNAGVASYRDPTGEDLESNPFVLLSSTDDLASFKANCEKDMRTLNACESSYNIDYNIAKTDYRNPANATLSNWGFCP